MNANDIVEMAQYAKSARYKNDSWLGKLPGSGPMYYHFLYALSQRLPNNTTFLVLGVNQAVCCAHICGANELLNVIGVDNNPTTAAWALHSSVNNFHYVIDLSIGDVALERIASHHALRPISAVFFDTTHTYEQVKGEYVVLKPFLSAGTVLVFDDVHAAENGVMRAVNEIPGSYIPLDYLHDTLGFGVKLYQV